MEKKFPAVPINRLRQCWYQLPSGSVIYSNGASEYSRWYDLDLPAYNDLMKYPSSYFAVVLGENPENTFVVPKLKLSEFFPRRMMTEKQSGNPVWYFHILTENGKKKLDVSTRREHLKSDIDAYLGNWNQIQDYQQTPEPTGSEAVQYLLLRSEPDSIWADKEGKEYHYGTNVPNYTKIVPGAQVIFDRGMKDPEYTGRGAIISVKETQVGSTTAGGRPYLDRYATISNYIAVSPAVVQSEEITRRLQSVENFNEQLSIRSIPKEVYEAIIESFNAPSPPKDWSSLDSEALEAISKNVLSEGSSRLEIPPETVKRIILHLISGKNVILTGPPGTGKTDLARRLLRDFGQIILGINEPVEAVASYEWGRYEVVGGNSLSHTDKEDGFHLGCVLKAIKENRLLLIDEFNRADMNKAFGELFLGLEHGTIDIREDEQPSWISDSERDRRSITIPSKFRMICTMNDYDRSLLNELSYGLLRRFAFVEIDVPSDIQNEERVVYDRLNVEIGRVGDDFQSVIVPVIHIFMEFLARVRVMRKIGVSTSIDASRYLLNGYLLRTKNLSKLLDEALVDYLIPQLDRLDISTTSHIITASEEILKANRLEVTEFDSRLKQMVQKLKSLDQLFASEDK